MYEMKQIRRVHVTTGQVLRQWFNEIHMNMKRPPRGYFIAKHVHSDKFVFCNIFHTKPYFFKETQFCHFCFDFNEINSKEVRITWRFIVYWLIIFT